MNGSRSKEIEVRKSPTFLPKHPVYLVLAHRHFQKEQGAIPAGVQFIGTIPLDLLTLAEVPRSLVEEIDSITVTYKRKGA